MRATAASSMRALNVGSVSRNPRQRSGVPIVGDAKQFSICRSFVAKALRTRSTMRTCASRSAVGSAGPIVENLWQQLARVRAYAERSARTSSAGSSQRTKPLPVTGR